MRKSFTTLLLKNGDRKEKVIYSLPSFQEELDLENPKRDRDVKYTIVVKHEGEDIEVVELGRPWYPHVLAIAIESVARKFKGKVISALKSCGNFVFALVGDEKHAFKIELDYDASKDDGKIKIKEALEILVERGKVLLRFDDGWYASVMCGLDLIIIKFGKVATNDKMVYAVKERFEDWLGFNRLIIDTKPPEFALEFFPEYILVSSDYYMMTIRVYSKNVAGKEFEGAVAKMLDIAYAYLENGYHNVEPGHEDKIKYTFIMAKIKDKYAFLKTRSKNAGDIAIALGALALRNFSGLPVEYELYFASDSQQKKFAIIDRVERTVEYGVIDTSASKSWNKYTTIRKGKYKHEIERNDQRLFLMKYGAIAISDNNISFNQLLKASDIQPQN